MVRGMVAVGLIFGAGFTSNSMLTGEGVLWPGEARQRIIQLEITQDLNGERLERLEEAQSAMMQSDSILAMRQYTILRVVCRLDPEVAKSPDCAPVYR